MSLTTPTTVRSKKATFNWRPNGSCPGQKRWDRDSLITATKGAFAVSWHLMSRPRCRGMRSVVKKSGVTYRMLVGTDDAPLAVTPGTVTGKIPPPNTIGRKLMYAAEETLGSSLVFVSTLE